MTITAGIADQRQCCTQTNVCSSRTNNNRVAYAQPGGIKNCVRSTGVVSQAALRNCYANTNPNSVSELFFADWALQAAKKSWKQKDAISKCQCTRNNVQCQVRVACLRHGGGGVAKAVGASCDVVNVYLLKSSRVCCVSPKMLAQSAGKKESQQGGIKGGIGGAFKLRFCTPSGF